MPQYDYRCQSCKKKFTVKLAVSEHEKKARRHRIRCPKCDSTDVKHVIESFFVTTSKKS